jgi:hypothetical protein
MEKVMPSENDDGLMPGLMDHNGKSHLVRVRCPKCGSHRLKGRSREDFSMSCKDCDWRERPKVPDDKVIIERLVYISAQIGALTEEREWLKSLLAETKK